MKYKMEIIDINDAYDIVLNKTHERQLLSPDSWVYLTEKERQERVIKSYYSRIKSWKLKKGYSVKMDRWCDKNIEELKIELKIQIDKLKKMRE